MTRERSCRVVNYLSHISPRRHLWTQDRLVKSEKLSSSYGRNTPFFAQAGSCKWKYSMGSDILKRAVQWTDHFSSIFNNKSYIWVGERLNPNWLPRHGASSREDSYIPISENSGSARWWTILLDELKFTARCKHSNQYLVLRLLWMIVRWWLHSIAHSLFDKVIEIF